MTGDPPSVEARVGFFPVVSGSSVRMERAGSLVVGSAGDVTIIEGGAQVVGAGGNLHVTNGGAQLLASGGNATIRHGGALAVIGRSVHVEGGFLGVALAPSTTIADDARVLMSTPQAAAFGAAAGLVVAIGLVLSRLRRP